MACFDLFVLGAADVTIPNLNRQRQLDGLITDIAAHLMGASVADAQEVMDRTLNELLSFFSCDQTFLRRLDHVAQASILEAEWPKRPVIPDPDPLHTIPFDADPATAASVTLDRTMIVYPEESPGLQERVEAGSGEALTTMAFVPLINEATTIGILGLIRLNDERWPEEEVNTLAAVASLLAQMWGRHTAEATVAHMAFHDELTDLPNRQHLTMELAKIADDDPVSFLVIGVDNMNVINDGLNYDTGNRFLVALADRLRSALRNECTIGRLNGDQFGVIITGSDPRNVETLAKRLVVELGQVLTVGGVPIVRSVSIGIAHRTGTTGGPETDLFRNADIALQEAKKNGKNRHVVFDLEIEARVARNFAIEIELRQALEQGDQLCLHYQPEVDLRTGEIVAVEALMRWHHPERGLLAAGLFIEAAEESGLIVEIGDYVVRESVAQLARWQDEHPDLVMRVNISPAQLMSRDLAGQLRDLVTEFEVRPDRLCVEVTEHVMIADHQFTMEILNEIRAMGITIALDDFGTGYSSMEQLKKLPIDAIKIDRVFMIDLVTSGTDGAIVDATIRLAEALDLATVAEGIEEEEQVEELLNRGCYRAQGFLLARPADPETISGLLGSPVKAGRLVLGEQQTI